MTRAVAAPAEQGIGASAPARGRTSPTEPPGALAQTRATMNTRVPPTPGDPEALHRAVLSLVAEVGRQRGAIEDLTRTVQELTEIGPTKDRPLFTTDQLSQYLQCSVRTVETLVSEGAITPLYVRGARRFTHEAVQAFVRSASGRRKRGARARTSTQPSALGRRAADPSGLSSTPNEQ